jgi:hypothetical protein
MTRSDTPQSISARVHGSHAERIYKVSENFVSAVLQNNDSLFTPGCSIWRISNLSELHRRFVQQPDTSQASFITKFQHQLENAAPDTYQLAAELVYIHILLAARNSISGSKKRTLINTILSWSSHPVSIPEELDQALNDGLATMGVAFGTYRPFQIAFFLEFIQHWKDLPIAEQQQLLIDPWAFKQMLFALPIRAAYAQREALLHIVHPDSFEAIVSRDHKQRIARAFAHLVTVPTDDIDQRIQQIRRQLMTQHGDVFHFYQPAIQKLWLGEYESTPEPDPVLELESVPPLPAQTATNHVFICYARQDEEFALSLAAQLQQRDITIWMDQLSLEYGVDWDRAIDDALYDCAVLLIILSPASVHSDEVRSELRVALNERKPIVPVLYQNCRIPRQLLNLQRADFTAHGPDDAAALRKLVRVLRR